MIRDFNNEDDAKDYLAWLQADDQNSSIDEHQMNNI